MRLPTFPVPEELISTFFLIRVQHRHGCRCRLLLLSLPSILLSFLLLQLFYLNGIQRQVYASKIGTIKITMGHLSGLLVFKSVHHTVVKIHSRLKPDNDMSFFPLTFLILSCGR